jgi:predicted DNA-binding transcriptional regulator AlpA
VSDTLNWPRRVTAQILQTTLVKTIAKFFLLLCAKYGDNLIFLTPGRVLGEMSRRPLFVLGRPAPEHLQAREEHMPVELTKTSASVSQKLEASTVKNLDEFINAAKLAEELGIAASTVRSWRSRNFGPKAVRVGRVYRYRRRDVEAWLDNQPVAGGTT